MPRPYARRMPEATTWLFIGAVREHIMRCRSAQFPDRHPLCEDRCCPNCCATCSTLRWFRDSADTQLTGMMNRFGEGLYDWQMADGSVDWSQIEAHWDDSGDACQSKKCLQASRKLAARKRAVGPPA